MSVIRDAAKEYEDALGRVPDLEDPRFASVKKLLRSAADDFEETLLWRLREDMPAHLARVVQSCAERAIEAVLSGDEKEFRRWISAEPGGWSGRGPYPSGQTVHNVIHGTLFETGALALRRKICEAHAEILKNERVLDLESQVASLVETINKQTAEIERLRSELRS